MISKNPSQFNSLALKQKQYKWLRTARYHYLRLIRQETNPRVIARGLACGVFAGCFPWFGFQTIIGIVLAFLLRGNKLAAALGTWVSNPFTYAPLFFFNFKIGQFIRGNYSSATNNLQFTFSDDWSQVINMGTEVLISLFIGSALVGLIASVATYFVTMALLPRKQKLQ